MEKLVVTGRVFYGFALAGLGLQMIFCMDFPYMLIPPEHQWIPGLNIVACISGTLMILAGAFIALNKVIVPASLILASALLLIFCFYFIPYELIADPDHWHFGQWENAAKELAFSVGAFVIAGAYELQTENPFIRFLSKLIPAGIILYALVIMSFGVDHFIYGKDAAEYIPTWIPWKVFWIYFTGSALLGSGIAILLRIKRSLIATLLGTMIFIWVIILHIPKVITAPAPEFQGELASAFLALAYCGIAFVIAGLDAVQKDKGPLIVKE